MALCPRPARSQGDNDDGVRRPEVLTIGPTDQFLGQLSPDGHTLFFVSNRNTVNEIFVQHSVSGNPKLAFDEGADVSWPRVSPDGKQLLYVSYRGNAAGQLCVRALPEGRRRCLEDGSSAVQA